MPKAVNTFIKSKLNKDLDARLIPNGEYRDAVNVQVSRSESDSVGSLENVLGNVLAHNFGLTSAFSCIGQLTDETNGCIYLFITNYTDTANELQRTYSTTASNFIYRYDTVSDVATTLVTGSFLNFSKTSPIHAVNILENFLFWTDNRNQPRKINLNLAIGSYYTTEDQISVAKYNPYRSMQLFQEVGANTGVLESNMKDVTFFILDSKTPVFTPTSWNNCIDL